MPRPRKKSSLRILRLTAATLVFISLTLALVDFTGTFAPAFQPLADIQLVPALSAGSAAVLAALIVVTLLGGRLYCSVVCPLGILQDIVARLSKPSFHFAKPGKRRWAVLAAFLVALFSGFTALAGLLDPYSLFGRLATHLIRPVVMTLNNLSADAAGWFDSYALYREPLIFNGWAALIAALAGFLIVTVPAWKNGRSYCGSLCPAGRLLGLLSRSALFKIRLDRHKCHGCGRCEKVCKASCLDSRAGVINHSECVVCFNCLAGCPKGALSYTLPFPLRLPARPASPDQPRREFFRTLLGVSALPVATALPAAPSLPPDGTGPPISPPGTLSAAHLHSHCTACHLCIGACPSRVLRPAFRQYGLKGFLQPVMDYTHGFCQYDCTLCSEICPAGAFRLLSVEEKHRTRIGCVTLELDLCVVHTQGTHCGACAEHCPTQAVTMKPHENGLTSPVIDSNICVGCGGCEFICPVRPKRAIYVTGLAVHERRAEIAEKPLREIDINSFGF